MVEHKVLSTEPVHTRVPKQGRPAGLDMLRQNMQAKSTVCGENKTLCTCDTVPIKASVIQFTETTLQFQ